MAYVAVTGGREAVKNAAVLLERNRAAGDGDVGLDALEKRLGLLIDRVMSEAGLYAPRCAALALRQSEGSPEEAVFLLRAYRSTLTRAYKSLPLDCEDMTLHRRISAAFKDIPGGQFLGATYDYTHRLLDFEPPEARAGGGGGGELSHEAPVRAPRVTRELRREGLIAEKDGGGAEPRDITMDPLSFPAERSARLQTLTRADTGFLSGLAYAGIRGFGPSHPTVGELRTGELEVLLVHPLFEGETISAGVIVVTEVEALFSEESAEAKREARDDPLLRMEAGQGDKADKSSAGLSLGMGYGLVLGRNDTKAIAMSVMDYFLSSPGDGILQNQEFVLLHGDCLEMNGFISHLKLPHYVTFQSKLDRVRRGSPEGTGSAGSNGNESGSLPEL
ncbi:MAG: carbon-phosphorus lyase complex subunit PhnI [Oscillospiraceae bacterium]|jgi:alpha-D-ribose 1-methylphosphonate 5-triphosphate synthase subunit PhnI|nr:carbon-phosphorus lyase complex subunit PhnI [Oscillospiraceae bacterium]